MDSMKKVIFLVLISFLSCAHRRADLRATLPEEEIPARSHTLAEFGTSDPDPYLEEAFDLANIIGLGWLAMRWPHGFKIGRARITSPVIGVEVPRR